MDSVMVIRVESEITELGSIPTWFCFTHIMLVPLEKVYPFCSSYRLWMGSLVLAGSHSFWKSLFGTLWNTGYHFSVIPKCVAGSIQAFTPRIKTCVWIVWQFSLKWNWQGSSLCECLGEQKNACE